ncbi:MAG: sulfatase-like hydrolase/transferase [Trueperaceae bacterium]|nr:sulfatase-like hydrolase/transferase [Trueperaceae bacterium]
MPDRERPNILLITADQLRYDHTGFAGHPVVRTPNLDALAAAGTTFTQTYAPAAVCVPSRQSILTGQYPSAHGAMSNQSSVPEGTPTIASRLRDSGYRTAAIGKMHFEPVYAAYGFDHMRLAEQNGQGWRIDDYHATFLRQRGLVDQWDLWDQQYEHRLEAPKRYWDSFGTATSELPDEAYHTTWIADETIRWIAERPSDAPFFAWTSFIKPHHPFDPPAPYDRMYDPGEVPLPTGWPDGWRDKPLAHVLGDPRMGYFDVRDMSERALRTVAAHYYGLITHIDHHVGRIVATLEQQGIRDRTWIVFTSDHGDYLGQYGLFLKYPNVPYDALARVPLVVAGPGGAEPQGRAVDDLASLIDLLPTFCTFAGATPPAGTQGVDLAPLLRGDACGLEPRSVLIEGNDGFKGVRTRDYKLLYHRSGQTTELYDLENDPDETRNVAADRPDIVREHLAHLVDHLIDGARDRYVFDENPAMVRFDDRDGAVRPSPDED